MICKSLASVTLSLIIGLSCQLASAKAPVSVKRMKKDLGASLKKLTKSSISKFIKLVPHKQGEYSKYRNDELIVIRKYSHTFDVNWRGTYGQIIQQQVSADYEQHGKFWQFTSPGWGEINEIKPPTKPLPKPLPVPSEEELKEIVVERVSDGCHHGCKISVIKITLAGKPRFSWEGIDYDRPLYQGQQGKVVYDRVERGEGLTHTCAFELAMAKKKDADKWHGTIFDTKDCTKEPMKLGAIKLDKEALRAFLIEKIKGSDVEVKSLTVSDSEECALQFGKTVRCEFKFAYKTLRVTQRNDLYGKYCKCNRAHLSKPHSPQVTFDRSDFEAAFRGWMTMMRCDEKFFGRKPKSVKTEALEKFFAEEAQVEDASPSPSRGRRGRGRRGK